jgi:hypothetical protein
MFGLEEEAAKEKGVSEDKVEQLIKRFDHLEGLFEEMTAEFGISVEELAHFCSKPDNFYGDAWDQMETARKQVDQKLQLDLNSIKNPKKTSQKYRDIEQSRQWLFVR